MPGRDAEGGNRVTVCQACGTDNPEGTTYCQQCATRLDAGTQQRVLERRAAHSALGIRWPAVMAAIVLALIITIVVLFVLGVL